MIILYMYNQYIRVMEKDLQMDLHMDTIINIVYDHLMLDKHACYEITSLYLRKYLGTFK